MGAPIYRGSSSMTCAAGTRTFCLQSRFDLMFRLRFGLFFGFLLGRSLSVASASTPGWRGLHHGLAWVACKKEKKGRKTLWVGCGLRVALEEIAGRAARVRKKSGPGFGLTRGFLRIRPRPILYIEIPC
jgi:hypothetical protein